jgi:hypothetical protein
MGSSGFFSPFATTQFDLGLYGRSTAGPQVRKTNTLTQTRFFRRNHGKLIHFPGKHKTKGRNREEYKQLGIAASR